MQSVNIYSNTVKVEFTFIRLGLEMTHTCQLYKSVILTIPNLSQNM